MQQPPRVRLANLPTPLVRLERLGAELGGAEIWVKRDDLTGLELSGNKVRKLEYVAADAIEAGCDTLVTEGTPQSNHCRATAAACARLGLHCTLLLRPAPGDTFQGNHLLDTLFGAETRGYDRSTFDADREQILTGVLAELRSRGRKPRWTPAGASEPIGCWGYLAGIAELAEQLQAADLGACDVVLAISSGGTYAGALLGTLVHRLDLLHLWAVPVSDDVRHHTSATRALCQATIDRFKLPVDLGQAELRFLDGYVGEGYAIPYAADVEAVRLAAKTEALVLDPVYTGKAFCALLDGVRDRRFGFERPVVFLHTGGAFSNFAWPDALVPRP
jgi:D-cysteine desulfhydrase